MFNYKGIAMEENKNASYYMEALRKMNEGDK